MLISYLAICASAVSVDLYKDQDTVYSKTVLAKQCKMSGKNYNVSGHMVYFISQCRSTSGSYTDDVYKYVHIWDNFSGSLTTRLKTASYWRLKLTPTGLYKNCRASGTIVKYK